MGASPRPVAGGTPPPAQGQEKAVFLLDSSGRVIGADVVRGVVADSWGLVWCDVV